MDRQRRAEEVDYQKIQINTCTKVHRLWLSAALVLSAGASLVAGNAYCLVCPNHTMCRYQGVSESCRARMLVRGLRQGESELILALHNRLRATVASGREFRGNQPPAADMRKLVWDRQLARIAQRWVDQCQYAHDDCRDMPGFHVGQNLYVIYGTESDATANWTATILSWYNEVEIFDTSNVHNFRTLGNAAHYTQMVGAATRVLGCGHAAWRDGDGDGRAVTSMYACNYGPSGNRFGRPLYTVGRPCTQCPPGHLCSPAVGLCESQFQPQPQQPQPQEQPQQQLQTHFQAQAVLCLDVQ